MSINELFCKQKYGVKFWENKHTVNREAGSDEIGRFRSAHTYRSLGEGNSSSQYCTILWTSWKDMYSHGIAKELDMIEYTHTHI